MNGEQIDYKAVLEDLKSRRSKLDQAIAGIEAMLGEVSSSVNSLIGSGTVAIHPDTFIGKTIVEAASMYLRMMGRPARSTDEITVAVNRGGLPVSKESVSAILMRDANAGGEIYKVGRGVWGLSEWYPGLAKRGKKKGTEKEVEGEKANGTRVEAGNEPESPKAGDKPEQATLDKKGLSE